MVLSVLVLGLWSHRAGASDPVPSRYLDGTILYSDMDKDFEGKRLPHKEDREAARKWSKQYVDKNKKHRSAVFQAIGATHAQINKAVEAAARAAEKTGDKFVAFFISHGGAAESTSRFDPLDGLIELNGNGTVSLRGMNNNKEKAGSINIFHDKPMKVGTATHNYPEAGEKEGIAFYLGLGKILKKHKIDTVIFLACDAGRASRFLQKIADDWDVLVVVPDTRLAVQVRPKGRVRVYIEKDHEGSGSNVAAAEENIVFGRFDSHWGHAFPAAWDESRKKVPASGFSDSMSQGVPGGSILHQPTPDCGANRECKEAVSTYCKMDPRPSCGQPSHHPTERPTPIENHQQPNQKMPTVQPKPVVVRKDIQASCNLSEDRSTMYFWSFNPRKEPGRYSLRCQNGFKDEMKVTAPEYAKDGDPQPGHYRSDGWFYHGSVTSGAGLAATACSTEFIGNNVRGGSPYAKCAGLDQPKPATFRECAVAGAASKLGQDLSGDFGTARYSGMFAVRVWNECGKSSVSWQAAVRGQSPVMSGAGSASGDIIAWTPQGSSEHLFAIVESVAGDQLTVIQGAQAGGQVARETVSARQVWHYVAE